MGAGVLLKLAGQSGMSVHQAPIVVVVLVIQLLPLVVKLAGQTGMFVTLR